MRGVSALILVVAVPTGCTAQQVQDAAQQSASRVVSAVASAAPALAADGVVVANIEGRFAQIDANSALHVAVSAHDGTVHITGRVGSASTAARFITAAKSTSGVRNVASRLSVDPHLPQATRGVRDFALAASVHAALAAQGGVNAFAIHVAAHDGVVTLSGDAPNAGLRDAMAGAAKRTPGVRSLVDRVRVST